MLLYVIKTVVKSSGNAYFTIACNKNRKASKYLLKLFTVRDLNSPASIRISHLLLLTYIGMKRLTFDLTYKEVLHAFDKSNLFRLP